MKNIFTSTIIMLFCLTVYAQQNAAPNFASVAKPKNKQVSPEESQQKPMAQFVSPISVQILMGSQGIGADVKYGITPKLSGRLGFGIIPVTANNMFGFSAFPVEDQLSAKFSNLHLLADYAPFNNKSYRLVGGAAYLVKGNANVIITPSGSYQFGSQTLNKDQIGSLSASVDWKGVAPYLGVALFKSFPNRLFNMNIDIGTYYLASPGTSFTGTKLLSDNNSQAAQFNQNMQGYRWLPVVQLNFNFRIK
ncbi:MAG: hypothetical protein M3O71_17830 [Bacteroidota bacterium]|nr:hypothetical protein [Bacteroidota bacterium]